MSQISSRYIAVLIVAGRVLDRKSGLMLCLLVVMVAIFASRQSRKAFWAPTRPATDSKSRAIPRWRLLTAYAVSALIIGGSFYDFVTDTETWPFSEYPMFSVIDAPPNGRFTIMRLYGITQWHPLSEFPLDDNRYLEPFDNSRIQNAFDQVLSRRQLLTALEDCLRRYDALRLSGIHHGPAVQGLRLYRVTWTPNPQASNLYAPDSKELLGEVSRTGSGEGQ